MGLIADQYPVRIHILTDPVPKGGDGHRSADPGPLTVGVQDDFSAGISHRASHAAMGHANDHYLSGLIRAEQGEVDPTGVEVIIMRTDTGHPA